MLFATGVAKGHVILDANSKPVIGCKFAGKNNFMDTQEGKFWCVMPELTASEVVIQSALLKRVKRKMDSLLPLIIAANLLDVT